MFKWGFLVLGAMAVSTLMLCIWERSRNVFSGRPAILVITMAKFRSLLVQVFIIAAIFRFIVPTFVAVSFLISQPMLESEVNRSREILSALSAQVVIDTTVGTVENHRLGEQKSYEISEAERLKESLATLERESKTLEQRIEKLDDEAGWRGWIPEAIGGKSSDERLTSSKARHEEIAREIEQIQYQIRERQEVLECIDRRLAGESCGSFLDKLSDAGKTGFTRISEIVEKSDDLITTLPRLLAVIVIKNIAIPLIFLMIAVMCSVPIAKYGIRFLNTHNSQSA